MKWKFFTVLFAVVLTLVGCGDDGNEEGKSNGDLNVDKTSYDNNEDLDDLNNNQNTRNFQNYDGKEEYEQMGDRNGNQPGDNNGENNNRYDVAEKAADKITNQIDQIDQAYVLTTDNNAYVAAGLDNNNNNNNNNNDNGDELTDEVKNKISDIVQSVDNDIDNVYVSTNPDFLDLADNYVNEADNGEPVEGFFDQIGNMIERIFPQDKD